IRFILFLLLVYSSAAAQVAFRHDLKLRSLPNRWDEALPLGNGMVGALVWEKDGKLRLSLDRADLWDLRPTADLNKFDFSLLQKNLKGGTYNVIQQLGDVPYERDPAPTKIPGAALELDLSRFGPVTNARLYIKEGVAELKWSNGVVLTTFIHSSLPVGWFRINRTEVIPHLVPPRYVDVSNQKEGNSVEGQGLARLGYRQGTLDQKETEVNYVQPGWNGFEYRVTIKWKINEGALEGVWAITSNYSSTKGENALQVAEASLARGYAADLASTHRWWKSFWAQSSISIPDSILERQWYLEQYKFACVARANTPPITLQSVWTADNGNLPPWKGDIHNDLNIQLSYWPAYSGNHLAEATGMVNWLHQQRPVFEKWTQSYFKVNGLNAPGVCTLDGKAMGGWVQYSLSPTTAGWLGHHFYLQWRYSMDRAFLRDRAYPWIRDVALFFQNISQVSANGLRKLPVSSSPEFYDNSAKAWFQETTNYDLSIIRWTYEKAAELALELGLNEEAGTWKAQLNLWPGLATDNSGLLLAPGHPYPESHRHFSHLLGVHPLGSLNYENSDDRAIIEASLQTLTEKGTKAWVGYSFAWLGNLYARMKKGEQAAEALRTFATCFCLSNSFHANGDQCGGKNSSYTYRPFTLEGNFAFAAGLQEMLLQSHDGVVRIFPAVPAAWKELSFYGLRAEGAFVISARRSGTDLEIDILSEKGGPLVLETGNVEFNVSGAKFISEKNLIRMVTTPGQKIQLKSKR
ncbi:MAG: hypothetical protein JNL40_17205, partial [Cyclobacteriaceae bacterium]|nr:hypothetical protein [Cyclobacteriaceae bacterium]